jgi:hypothetical protein
LTDTAIQNARAVRDEMAQKIAFAEEQIKEWRARMQRAERFIADWQEFSGEQIERPSASEAARRGIAEPTGHPASKPKNPKKEEVAEAAVEIIRKNGAPMSRDDLFDALQSEGVIIHGKNAPVVLQTMLWRMQDRIVHLKGYGYWPREDAYMAADYVDNSESKEDDKISDEDTDSLI